MHYCIMRYLYYIFNLIVHYKTVSYFYRFLIGDTKKMAQRVLLERFFPYINPSTCRKLYHRKGTAAYVTYDKFCAGPILSNSNLDYNMSVAMKVLIK